MRISDWSSDVCSSDLGLGALRRAQQRLRLLGDAGAVADEVELAHQLPAPGAVLPAHSRVAAALGLAVAAGGGVDPRPALDSALHDAASLMSAARRVGKGWGRTCISRLTRAP